LIVDKQHNQNRTQQSAHLHQGRGFRKKITVKQMLGTVLRVNALGLDLALGLG